MCHDLKMVLPKFPLKHPRPCVFFPHSPSPVVEWKGEMEAQKAEIRTFY